MSTFKSQAARDAEDYGYGTAHYWEGLDAACIEHRDYYLARGDSENADRVMSESLGDALRGNDGD